MEPDPYLSFPPFRLDPVKNRLWRGEQPIPLRPKPLAVLRYLIEQQGRVVTADELLHALWPNTVVSASTIKVVIRAIRHALEDEAATSQFIETVPRRGYRWVGTVVSGQSSVVSEDKAAVKPLPLATENWQLATPLVGREAELKRLHGWLGKSLGGTRQVVFVTGEPGIGKTSVVDAFVAGLGGVGQLGIPVWIARGQCVEQYGAGEAYLPILEALERLCREPGHERLLPLLRQHAPLWL
ncbi:MAG: winged helix-turn-helix domain-containing protein, partial [Candidatus Binatia bacterium]